MFYTYPNMTWLVNGGSGDFLLRNVTDNNREFKMTGLLTGETITINTDLQIVTATQSPNILSKITTPVNFFRLLNGVNELFVYGDIVSLTISYTPMKRFG